MKSTTATLGSFAAAAGLVLLGGSPARDPSPRAATPPASLADSGHEGKAVHGIGYVEPASEVHRLCFQVGGIIRRCLVDVGDTVQKGDTLIILDDVHQQTALAVAEAELRVAEAERARVVLGVDQFQIHAAQRAVELWTEKVEYATRVAVRCRRLRQRDATSQSECDEAETSLRQATVQKKRMEARLQHLEHAVRAEDRQLADAKVTLARRRLERARRKTADTRLAAPFDGTVLEILRREGEAVSDVYHEPVLLFGDLRQLRVRAEIDERYVRQIKEGQTAVVSGRGLGARSVRGRVVRVKEIMGKKTVFSRASAERKDLDVVQALIEMDGEFTAPVGLRVDIKVMVDSGPNGG